MSRKRGAKAHRSNVYQLEQALIQNGRAWDTGGQRKSWSAHDLKVIKPMTPGQRNMFEDFYNGYHVCVSGSAGTGKSFCALYLALTKVLDPDHPAKRIIIVRSAVPTRELGHMPGTLEEKTALYEMPYADMFQAFIGRRSTYQDMKEAGLVEFCTTSFVRGLTWDDAIVVVDECQNMTFHEINSVITRIGDNTRLIMAGDLPQTDLRRRGEVTGMDKFMAIAENIDIFSCLAFTRDDIVRSDFVKQWIIASEDYDNATGFTS